jgi:serine/threonine-protein kinase
VVLVRSNELIGKEINGRYLIEGVVGSGGSSVVVAAKDLKKHKFVAIKLLHPELMHEAGFMRRFLLESRATSALVHPNIIAVYDWGTFESKPYLVTELLMGGTLKGIIDSGKLLTHSQALFVGIQAVRGLQYAHDKNFIHRDIKPANILFDTKCGAVIGDFGLATALSQAGWTEPVGSVLGTARYASPEQAKGVDLDGKSDVYSMGLVMYEMLTGYIPFQKDSPLTTLTNRIDSTLPADERLGPFEEIVMAMTDPDKARRLTAKQTVVSLEKLAKKLDPPEFLPLSPTKIVLEPDHMPRLNLDEMTTKLDLKVVDKKEALVHDGEDLTLVKLPEDSLSDTNAEDLIAAEQMAVGPNWKKDEPPSARSTKKRSKLVYIIPAIIILLLAVVILIETDNYVIYSQIVPNLKDQSLATADLLLKNEKLIGKESKAVYSNTVKAGYIISQYPAVASREKPNQTVTYVVSKGPFPVSLPSDIIGSQLSVAEAQLTKLGFKYTLSQQYSETVVSQVVISANPASGKYQPGQVVQLTVSEGPEPRTIPNLTNQSLAQAEANLKTLVLNYQVKQVYSTSVASGNIINTVPAAGQTVQRGSTVILNESIGPQYVSVPNVNGLTIIQAKTLLSNDGLNVVAIYGPGVTAYTTNPPAGSSVIIGTNITLYTE